MIKIYFVFLVCMISAGYMLIKGGQPMFQVKEAWYQSWMVNENEKGTNIYIELVNVPVGVKFDSLIFRNILLPTFVVEESKITKIKSILNVGVSRLSIIGKPVNKPDQLLYLIDGKRYTYPLKLVRRKMVKNNYK